MKINPTLSKTLALVAPVTLLTVSSSFGASDYLLEIEGIKGESTDAKHKDWIEVLSFSWGASNSSAAGSGGGAGKASFQDMHFTMKVDKASPKLMLACATGQPIPTVKFIVSRADAATGETTDYYTVILSNVLVSSYKSSGPPQPPAGATTVEPLTASLSLNYTKIKWDYIAPDNEVISVEHDVTPPPVN
jgi:type VI secretion system secreted protein Hcp